MPAFKLYSIFCSVARLQSVFFGETDFPALCGASPKGNRTVGHISLPGALTFNLLQTAPSASSVLKTLLQAD
jgi:hypothetical protein